MPCLVLTAVPGDPDYNAAVQLVRCRPGPNFDIADMPYTSAAEVQAGITAGKLTCVLGLVLAAPVTG